MLKKIWTDQVWSKVIAAGIIAAIGAVFVTYRSYWLPAVENALSTAWAYSTATTPVHRWVFWLLVMGWVLFVVFLIGVAQTFYPEKKTTYLTPLSFTPDWYNYNVDTFYQLKWRWTYGGGDGTEISLLAFCPTCDYQVYPDDPSDESYGHIVFHCASCNRIIARATETWRSLKSKVTRLIQQKIRTNSYPGATKSNS